MVFAGTVHDPPLAYDAECPVELGQNGNLLTGKICGRDARTDPSAAAPDRRAGLSSVRAAARGAASDVSDAAHKSWAFVSVQ